MRPLCCCSLLTVVLCGVVTKCDTETTAERAERYATAKQWGLYPEARVYYYISHISKPYRDAFLGVIGFIMEKINDDGCVEMIKTESPSQAQILIYGTLQGANNTWYIATCDGSGKSFAEILFNMERPDRRDYFRGILKCLAPFFYEHQRFDRDPYMNVYWSNIADGMENEFMPKYFYPPSNFPDFNLQTVVRVPWDYLSKNGKNTYEPKDFGPWNYYNTSNFGPDLERLRFYYRKLDFPKKYRESYFWGWYTYETYKMAPKDACL